MQKEPLNWIDIKVEKSNSNLTFKFQNECNKINNKDLLFLLIVHSNAVNFKARIRLRNKLCKENVFNFLQMYFVVSTGISNANINKSQTLKDAINLESNNFGDILQLTNIIENYHNISFKVILKKNEIIFFLF